MTSGAPEVITGGWSHLPTFDHSSPRAIAPVYPDLVQAIKPDLWVKWKPARMQGQQA